jgi:hypothetical protein
MAARAGASYRTDGPIDMKAPFEPVRQGLGRRALAHEGRGPNHEASNPWGGIGGALGITPRPILLTLPKRVARQEQGCS